MKNYLPSVLKPVNIALVILLLLHFSVNAQQKSKITLSLYENPVNNTIKLIKNATSNVQAVVYKFEEESLLNEIIKAQAKGVKIQLIVDAKESKSKKSLVKLAKENGVKVRKWRHGKLHAKFTIIDKKTVITGSFNWTNAAKNKNLELIIIEENKSKVDNYILLFNDLWKRAKKDKK